MGITPIPIPIPSFLGARDLDGGEGIIGGIGDIGGIVPISREPVAPPEGSNPADALGRDTDRVKSPSTLGARNLQSLSFCLPLVALEPLALDPHDAPAATAGRLSTGERFLLLQGWRAKLRGGLVDVGRRVQPAKAALGTRSATYKGEKRGPEKRGLEKRGHEKGEHKLETSRQFSKPAA